MSLNDHLRTTTAKAMTQVMLIHETKDGVLQLTTWLPADKRLKQGIELNLKDDDRRWKVAQVYSNQFLHDIDNRGWDNNDYSKHKGLNL